MGDVFFLNRGKWTNYDQFPKTEHEKTCVLPIKLEIDHTIEMK